MKSEKIFEVTLDNPVAMKAFGELMLMLGFEETSQNEYLEKPKKTKKK